MTLKDRLDAGEVCVGPFLKLSDPAVVEIMALAAFDHVVIDLEHGPLSVETAQNLVRAARLRGIAPYRSSCGRGADAQGGQTRP